MGSSIAPYRKVQIVRPEETEHDKGHKRSGKKSSTTMVYRKSTNPTEVTASKYKRGVVGLTAPVDKQFIVVGTLALLSVVPFRIDIIEKPFAKKSMTYRFSRALGCLAASIWSRNSGILRPDGLIKVMSEKFSSLATRYTPFDVIRYMLDTLDAEISNMGEIRAQIIVENFLTKFTATGK
jgi:hypothetical protein